MSSRAARIGHGVRRFATSHPWRLASIAAASTAVVCAGLFYLTPLHFLDPVDLPMHDVDPAAVYAQMQSHPERYLFIDVRNAPVYAAEHAAGAINIPIHDFYDEHFAFPKNKTIVLICGDGKLAGVAYGYLERYGFLDLARIEGGLAAWKSEGLPVVDK